jgi:hypothetical protein
MNTNLTFLSVDDLIEKFESHHIRMWIEGDILYCKFVDDLHLSLEVAKSCVEGRIYFSKGKSYSLLADMRGVKSTTKKARQYLLTIGMTLVKACAVVIASSVDKTIGNLFLSLERPQVPIRLFTDEEKAKDWLLRYA